MFDEDTSQNEKATALEMLTPELRESLDKVASSFEELAQRYETDVKTKDEAHNLRAISWDMQTVPEWGPYFAKHLQKIAATEKTLSVGFDELKDKALYVPNGPLSIKRIDLGNENGVGVIAIEANRIPVNEIKPNLKLLKPARAPLRGEEELLYGHPDANNLYVSNTSGAIFMSETMYDFAVREYLELTNNQQEIQ